MVFGKNSSGAGNDAPPGYGEHQNAGAPVSENYGQDPNQQQEQIPDILTALNIAPGVQIPNDLLTTEAVSHVQFRVSEPQGYLHSDVEEFHSDVKKTVSWFQGALRQRDADIARLATEYDRRAVDLQNAVYEREFSEGKVFNSVSQEEHNRVVQELEALRAGGSGGGGPLTDEERQAYEGLQAWAGQVEESYAALEAENESLRAGGAGTNAGGALNDEERQAYEELQAWAGQVEESYSTLEAENEQLKSELEALRAGGSSGGGPLTDEERQAYEGLQAWAGQVEESYAALEAENESLRAGGAGTNAGADGVDDSTLVALQDELENEREAHQKTRDYAAQLDEYINQITPLLEAQESGNASDVVYEEPQQPAQHVENDVQPSHPDDDFDSGDVPAYHDAQYGNHQATLDPEEDALPAIVTPFTGRKKKTQATKARTDESPDESFARMLKEQEDERGSDAPELGQGIRYTPDEEEPEEELRPGDRLKSLRPGEKLEDVL